MIAPSFPPAVVAALTPFQRAFAEHPLPHVELPAAVSPGLAASLRGALGGDRMEAFDLAPRGRYERSDQAPDADLVGSLVNVASFLADRDLRLIGARWMRARHGSYALTKDDAPPEGTTFDVVLDVSESATGEGQAVYTHRGQAYFVAAQVPGTLALVARTPTVRRYFRHVTHRAGDRVIVRLLLSLGERAPG